MERSELGRKGEKLAEDFLRKRGYRVLCRNYRSRLGEIDLVCQDRGTVVFVEVKTRTSNRFGAPVEAVGPRKQQKLRSLAQEFLIRNRLESADIRFDVLGLMLDSEPPGFEHITAAF